MPRQNRRLGPLLGGSFATLIAVFCAVMLVGGYFEHRPFALAQADPGAHLAVPVGADIGPGVRPGAISSARLQPPLAAIYWSGDMGMRLGVGEGLVDELTARGIPVLTVSSPMLFAEQRDRAFVDAMVTRSVRTALARTGAERVVVIGNSFGADIIATGLGRLPEDLRRRVASVILMVPGTEVYFQANPMGLTYRGPVAADPVHTIPLLRGIPVTCIYGLREEGSLCPTPVMASAARVPIADGHLMLWSRPALYRAVLRAIAHPPQPMT